MKELKKIKQIIDIQKGNQDILIRIGRIDQQYPYNAIQNAIPPSTLQLYPSITLQLYILTHPYNKMVKIENRNINDFFHFCLSQPSWPYTNTCQCWDQTVHKLMLMMFVRSILIIYFWIPYRISLLFLYILLYCCNASMSICMALLCILFVITYVLSASSTGLSSTICGSCTVCSCGLSMATVSVCPSSNHPKSAQSTQIYCPSNSHLYSDQHSFASYHQLDRIDYCCQYYWH